MNVRLLKRVVIACVIFQLIAACATRSGHEHGLDVAVGGSVPIDNIHIEYGTEQITFFSGRNVPNSGALYNAQMPIPERMTVSWVVSGKQIRAVVPLSSMNYIERKRLRNWALQFNGEVLEVWREERVGSEHQPVGMLPMKRTKMYP